MVRKPSHVRWPLPALLAVAVLTPAAPAAAYQLKSDKGGACQDDGSACNVLCDTTNYRAGVMYWNGSVWTDGVRSDPDREVVARKICQAAGTACT